MTAPDFCKITLQHLSAKIIEGKSGRAATPNEVLAIYDLMTSLHKSFPSLKIPKELKICIAQKACAMPLAIVTRINPTGEVSRATTIHEIGHHVARAAFADQAFQMLKRKMPREEFDQIVAAFDAYFYQKDLNYYSTKSEKDPEKLKLLAKTPILGIRKLTELSGKDKTIFSELLSPGGTKRAYEEVLADLLAASHEENWDAIAIEVNGSSARRTFPIEAPKIIDRGDEHFMWGPAPHHIFPMVRHAIRVKVGDRIKDKAYMDKFMKFLLEKSAADFAWMVENYPDDYIYMWLREEILTTLEGRLVEAINQYSG